MWNRNLSVVYVTRPIQYLNVINIPELESKCILLLENSFSGFDQILHIAKKDQRWTKIITVNNYKEVMCWLLFHQHKFSKYYTFTDNGISWQIVYNFLLGVDVILYEEGAATYMTRKLTGQNKFLYSILNPGKIADTVYLGYCRKIKKIYVYDPELHLKAIGCHKQVFTFREPFFHFSKTRNLAAFYYPDFHKFKGMKILLYITSWDYNDQILPIIDKYADYCKILKPHPHFEGNKDIQNIFDEIIDSTCLAEFLISDLMSVCADLIIIHQCSTCILHLAESNNVKILNLTSKYSSYSSYLKLLSLRS